MFIGHTLYLFFFLVVGAHNSFAASVADICPIGQMSTFNENSQQIKDSVCSIASHSNDLKVISLSQEIVRILLKLPESSKVNINESSNNFLKKELSKLKNRLNSLRPQLQLDTQSVLAQSLDSYLKNPKDAKHTTIQAITSRMNSIMAQTETGRKIIACFEDEVGTEKKYASIEYSFSSDVDKLGASGAYHTHYPEKQKSIEGELLAENRTKPIKVLQLTPTPTDPMDELLTYAHEMQHGCNRAEKDAREKTLNESVVNFDNCKATRPVNLCTEQDTISKIAFRDYYENVVIDEMRSFKVMVDLFKEIAKADPKYFCSVYSAGGGDFFKKGGVFSDGEIYNGVEQLYKKGQFARHVVDFYYDNFYKGQPHLKPWFYKLDSKDEYLLDASGERILTDQFESIIKENGF